MMEPRLARSMRLLGIPFVQVGPAIDFRGKRAPYYINAELFHSRLAPELVYLFGEIDGRVKQGMMGITLGSAAGIPLSPGGGLSIILCSITRNGAVENVASACLSPVRHAPLTSLLPC